jgi:hypothetical protein
MALQEWIERLLATAAVLGGYPPAAPLPQVTVIAQDALSTRVCGGPCAVKGAFIPGQGLFIINGLEIETDPQDRSVLLHELVHYLQDLNGRYAGETACDRFRYRELEAYRLQDEYLSRYGLGVNDLAARLEWQSPGCLGQAGAVQTFVPSDAAEPATDR